MRISLEHSKKLCAFLCGKRAPDGLLAVERPDYFVPLTLPAFLSGYPGQPSLIATDILNWTSPMSSDVSGSTGLFARNKGGTASGTLTYRTPNGRLSLLVGALMSLAWVVGCLVVAAGGPNGLAQLSGLTASEWAMLVTGATLPLFLMWSFIIGRLQQQELLRQMTGQIAAQAVRPSQPRSALTDAGGSRHMNAVADEFDGRIQKFHGQIDDLSSVLVGLTAQVESQNQTLDSLADRVRQRTKDISDQISTQTRQIDQAEEKVDGLMARVTDSANLLLTMSHDMQEQVEKPVSATAQGMRQTVDDLENQLERLDLKLTSIQQEYRQTVDAGEKAQARLSDDSETLRLASEAAMASIDGMATRLSDQINNMDATCLGAIKDIAQVQHDFTLQGQNLSRVSEGLRSQITEISSAIESQNDQLESLGQTAMAYGNNVVDQARKNADTLNRETGLAVEKLAETMDAQLGAMNAYVDSQSTYMEGTARRLEKRLTETLARGEQLLDGLTQANSDSVENLDAALSTSLVDYRRKVAVTLSALKDDVAALSTDEVDRLDALKERVAATVSDLQDSCESNLDSMATRAAATVSLLSTQSDSLSTRLDAVSAASEQLHERLSNAADSLGRELVETLDNRIRTHSNEADGSIQTLAKALDNGLDAWRTKLNNAIDHARDATHSMVATTAENLQHLTLESSDSIISSGERIPTLAKDMVEAATQARRDIDSIARELEATLAHVLKTVDETSQTTQLVHRDLSQTPARLDAATSALSDMTTAIATHAQSVETHATSLEASSDRVLEKINANTHAMEDAATVTDKILDMQTARLTKGANDVVQSTQKFADDVLSLTTQTENRLQAMADLSNNTAGTVNSTGEAVGHQIEEFARQANDLRGLLTSVGGLANEHGLALQRVGEEAENRAKRLMSLVKNDQRDAFLGSAERLVDRLHGLAIDVNSVMDGQLDPAVVRAFQEGDRGIAVRRLLAMGGSSEGMVRIAHLYTQDPKFKERVDLYVDGFDDLLSRAAKADTTKLLHTTFLTADIGKLYVFLTQSLGVLAAAE